MRQLLIWLNRIINKHKALKRWKRIVTVLAAIITFATTYALILPAITVEKNQVGEVSGMYLERGEDPDEMLEENALLPEDAEISADNADEEADAATPWTDAPTVKMIEAAGDDYTVTLTYDATSGIPEGAALDVSEIAQDSEDYQIFLEESKKAMGLTEEDTLPNFAGKRLICGVAIPR